MLRRFRLPTILAAGAAIAALAGPAFADAAPHVYDGVTPAVLDCVMRLSAEEHGTRYESTSADAGTATTATALWSVTLSYTLNPANSEIAYALVEKSWVVPESAIWPGIEDTIARCR